MLYKVYEVSGTFVFRTRIFFLSHVSSMCSRVEPRGREGGYKIQEREVDKQV